MRVHSHISVVVRDVTALAPVEGVEVLMAVQAGRKNPHRILFPKTDARGVATLKREEVVRQFEAHASDAPMDYDGTLDSASSVVRLTLLRPGNSRLQASEVVFDLRESGPLYLSIEKRG